MQADVVLVMMPFGPARMPSLGLSLLAQVLRDADIPVRVEYPIVDFLRKIGSRDYDVIVNSYGKITLGEWIFSRFVDPVGTEEEFIDLHVESGGPATRAEELRQLIAKAVPIAGRLIEEYAAAIVRMQPSVVGFSTSFQQQMACLALAKRLRQLLPDVKIVLGGANCSSPMGEQTFLSYPVLDAVVVGPGEISFARLVRQILDGATDIRIPGVYWRGSSDGSQPVKDPGIAPEPPMDDLPYPYYDDFFEVWPENSEVPPLVPIEGSRGCWWGQKQHCVFCSLNHDIHYRSKSPERLYREVVHLHEQRPGLQLFAMDDILDLRVIGEITKRLAELPTRPNLYYSLKSNIRKDQLQALARAGVNGIQPGVESLADEVLSQMRKGVTGLRNLQLLKWARELDMRVSWSLLYGFPFDRAEYYERMRQWVPSLTHLPPPRGVTDVRIQRYSPLYFQAEHFGVKNLRPRKFYSLIYNLDQAAIDRLAYNFDWDPPEDQTPYIEPLRKEVNGWMKGLTTGLPFLFHVDRGNGLVVGDTRPAAVRSIHRLGAADRIVCLACDQVAKRHQIEKALCEAGHGDQVDSLEGILVRLIDDKLMLHHDGFYLFLPCELRDTAQPPADFMRQVLAPAA